MNAWVILENGIEGVPDDNAKNSVPAANQETMKETEEKQIKMKLKRDKHGM